MFDVSKLTPDKWEPIIANMVKLIGLETRKIELMHEMIVTIGYQARPNANTPVLRDRIRNLVTVDFGPFIQVHCVSHYNTLVDQRVSEPPTLQALGLLVLVARPLASEGDDYMVYAGRKHIDTRRRFVDALGLLSRQ
jgi:hypothetical protein